MALIIHSIFNLFHIIKKTKNVIVQTDKLETNNQETEKILTGEDIKGVDRAIIFATNIYDSLSELVNFVYTTIIAIKFL